MHILLQYYVASVWEVLLNIYVIVDPPPPPPPPSPTRARNNALSRYMQSNNLDEEFKR